MLGFLGFIALVQGVLGLVARFADLDRGLVRRLDFLDGYEVYASVALIVLSFALFAAAESRRSR
ncbi:hypothetical protein GCM10010129_26420 [Streptomyces fumigatiscleroticus]|nr:hypothetical protein GCM10010129_26420 [Streptomyces fumigatiscleroticus]